MCLFSRPEYDVEFANRSARPRKETYVRSSRPSQTRISETIIHERPTAQYVPAPSPRSSAPVIREATPPAPSPPPSPRRIELVSVVENVSPRGSRASVSNAGTRKSSDRRSRGGEEVYIERERIRERLTPSPRPVQKEELETYRYVEARPRGSEDGRRRSKSITYETNPRVSQRTVERERERVVEVDGGRRREYYRRP